MQRWNVKVDIDLLWLRVATFSVSPQFPINLTKDAIFFSSPKKHTNVIIYFGLVDVGVRIKRTHWCVNRLIASQPDIHSKV